MISYRFQFEKAAGAMAYLLRRLGRMDKVKLVKLLYIADRSHFILFGYPITGSRQVAMDHGPLPSECLELLDGEYRIDPDGIFKFIHIENHSVDLADASAIDWLNDSEKASLEKVAEGYGMTPTWDLVNHTHKFPEYEAVFKRGTSRPITYEELLRHYKGEEGFRHNRPVVTEEMLQHMEYPVSAKDDSDL